MGYLYACFLLWIFTLHSNILPIIIAPFVWRQHCASSLLCHNQGFWVTCNLHMLSLRLGLSVCSFDSVTHRTNVQFCWIFNCLMLFLQVMFQVWCLQTMTELSLVNHTPTFFHKFSNFLFYIPVSDLNLVIVWASSMYLILLWLWQNPWGESRSRTEVRFWLTIIKTSFHSWVTFESVEWQYILYWERVPKRAIPSWPLRNTENKKGGDSLPIIPFKDMPPMTWPFSGTSLVTKPSAYMTSECPYNDPELHN